MEPFYMNSPRAGFTLIKVNQFGFKSKLAPLNGSSFSPD